MRSIGSQALTLKQPDSITCRDQDLLPSRSAAFSFEIQRIRAFQRICRVAHYGPAVRCPAVAFADIMRVYVAGRPPPEQRQRLLQRIRPCVPHLRELVCRRAQVMPFLSDIGGIQA